jgi:DNA mismatch repair protein MutS2
MKQSDGHSLNVLDYPRLREWLAGMCQTAMGRELALSLEPLSDEGAVRAEFDRLDELLALPEEPALAAIADVRPLLDQLRAEGTVDGADLLVVQRALAGSQQCREFYSRHRESLPGVWPIAAGLAAMPDLARAIESAIDESGAVRDSASPELARVRVQLRRRRNAMVERLERLAADNPGWFNGGVTVKGGRYVLPLTLERRRDLPGVVHASSGSGQTLFVEPLDVVGDGNELQELRDAEAEEVARILRDLSQRVAAAEPVMTRTMAAAGSLDLLNARRRFAQRLDCTRPEVSTDGSIDIVAGRHPLLAQRKGSVVPLNFRLDPDTRIVLISGPNAGGKTVVLKTVGLFALMAASGLPLPAAEGTRLPLFGSVFADIGDEQSLDEDLSSFTAHLGRLRDLLAGAGADSLVLVDEIGSSTSPEEGAALAIAVLEELRARRTLTVVTTHFGMLKVFVQNEPGMVNAAMEYRDGPTYRFRVGMPGESSAFETAAVVGLPEAVLERARARMGREWLDFDAKLKALDAELEAAFRKDLLGGVTVVTGSAQYVDESAWGGTLYRPSEPKLKKCSITAIPYYAWCNRGKGDMAVWIRE